MSPKAKRTRRRKRGVGYRIRWPKQSTRRRWIKRYRRLPLALQVLSAAFLIAFLWLSLNWFYQVIKKPSELFFPVSGTLHKTPLQTWRSYGPIFRAHATDVMTADLLAALAQVEASGNPVARTYWRWSFTSDPLDIYRPASSAVGMYQFTDGTFELARRYCIHDHKVVEDGPWHDLQSCWFNGLYTRVVPSHAVEMTSAYLHRQVVTLLGRHRVAATFAQKQRLAAVIHLCGGGAGNAFAARGFVFAEGQRCGDHDPRVYLSRVARMQAVFRAVSDSPSAR